MVRTRAARIDAIPVPDVEVDDPDGDGRVLVLGWGSTYGPIGAACRALRQREVAVAQAHLRHLNPMPANLGAVLCAYDQVVHPRDEPGPARPRHPRRRYLVDAIAYNQVRGLPFTSTELECDARGCDQEWLRVPLTLTAKDFKTDQEVRWCPGCGDYAILAAVQCFMPELQHPSGADRLHLGHRLLVAVPVLHGDVRRALDPRPGAGDRHRARGVPPRPVGLGGDR